MVEEIKVDGTIAALIIRASFKKDKGIQFFTKNEDTLQLGYMNRHKGYEIQPHVHMPIPRVIEYTNEVLFIKSGKVKINFYNKNLKYEKSCILLKDDVVLLSTSGHGFEMIEDSEIIEVKQGPYVGEDDKNRFNK